MLLAAANVAIRNALPMLSLEEVTVHSHIATLVSAARGVLFRDVKVAFIRALCEATALAAGPLRPRIVVNRCVPIVLVYGFD